MNLKKFFTLLVLLLSCGFIQNAIGQNTSTIQFANPNTTCNGATPTQFCIDVTLQSAGAAYNTEGWATFVNYNTAVLGAPTVTVNSAFTTKISPRYPWIQLLVRLTHQLHVLLILALA